VSTAAETLDEATLERLVDEVLAAHDPQHTPPARFLGARFDAGLAWLDFPPGHGGLGAPRRWQPMVERRFRDAGAASPMRSFIGVGMAGPTIAAEGTDDQRRRYLRACFTGEDPWCQLFSEPGAGSDVAALATRAERDGDEWVITGQKVWSSFAHIARRGMLLARTDPHVPKHRGLTYFLLDMHASGVRVEPLRQMTGDAEFNEVWLDEVRVPDADRVGEVGRGWSVALTTLMNERATLGGGGEARRRPIDTVLDAYRAHPTRAGAVRDRMIRAWIGSEVLRLTNARAAVNRRSGTPGPEGSIGKLATAEQDQVLRNLHVDLLGPNGTGYTSYEVTRPERFGSDSPQRSFLRSRAATIEGGTSEIMRNILGERVLGLPPEPRTDRDLPWTDVPRS
jgi:alkylation response protein AidB-like acyl-CoA dehydrogenase